MCISHHITVLMKAGGCRVGVMEISRGVKNIDTLEHRDMFCDTVSILKKRYQFLINSLHAGGTVV